MNLHKGIIKYLDSFQCDGLGTFLARHKVDRDEILELQEYLSSFDVILNEYDWTISKMQEDR